jgi:hypothetical protein
VPPLDVLADTIQPFPTFAKVYLAAVKALRGKVTAARVPAPVGGRGRSNPTITTTLANMKRGAAAPGKEV